MGSKGPPGYISRDTEIHDEQRDHRQSFYSLNTLSTESA